MLVIMRVLGMLGCRGLRVRPDREISCSQSQVYLGSYLRGQEKQQQQQKKSTSGQGLKQLTKKTGAICH